jgi:hypothetical protein
MPKWWSLEVIFVDLIGPSDGSQGRSGVFFEGRQGLLFLFDFLIFHLSGFGGVSLGHDVCDSSPRGD